jgi:hypothetical protein
MVGNEIFSTTMFPETLFVLIRLPDPTSIFSISLFFTTIAPPVEKEKGQNDPANEWISTGLIMIPVKVAVAD